MHNRKSILALTLAFLMSAAVAQAQTKIKSGFNLFSPEQDVEVGQQSAAEAERQLPIMTDREVDNYVSRIGQRLAANAGGPQFRYQFRVVNASDINAFALPGGYVYINRGIIDQSRSEGEVAGVMAHEIAHVALRHGTHQASKAYAAQAGLSILGGLLGGKVGQGAAGIINAVGGFGLNVVFLKFSRELETQADVRGAQILAASGYAPADMVSFFQTLARVDTQKKTNFLSDHPAPPDRIQRIEKEAKLLRVTEQPTSNVAELHSIQSRMRSSYGNAPTMAQIARNAPTANTGTAARQPSQTSSTIQVDAPSSSLRTYRSRSGVYSLAYPSNWRVYEEGNSGVTIAPEGGVGNVDGRTEVVYGAIVNHYDPFGNAPRNSLRGGGTYGSGNVTLDSATQDLVTEIQRGGGYLQPVNRSTQRFRLSGGDALATSLRGRNPSTGVDERVTVVTRQLEDDHLVYMLFITPQRDASRYNEVLTAMINSMRIDENHQH